MVEFSELRLRCGLSVADAAEFLGVSQRKATRYELGEARLRSREAQAMRGLALAVPRLPFDRLVPRAASQFTFVDLFAGIGGLRKGFELAGGQCIFTSEWDRYSQKTYQANFPDDLHEIAGDIRNITADMIPQHDILIAGFPCQPFSIAGVSKKNALNRPHGFLCDAQGTLFYEVARILKHHRPKAFLLENVKNLVNHDRGRTFEIIHRALTEDLGYNVYYKVIDARSWVPQHRERIFMVGFRESNNFSFDDLSIPDPFDGPRLGSVLHPENGTEPSESPFTLGCDGIVSEKYTLSNHLWGYLRAYAEKHRAKGNGFGFGLFGHTDVTRTLSARYYKDGSEILIEQSGKNPRRLTPRECARLMGFDRPGVRKFTIPVSDTQAYKQFGNSVVVPVVEAVALHMAPWVEPDVSHDLKRINRRSPDFG